nr:hypothetical protein [Tanacetum cinerariifolium]GEX78772.1 hypothetical protein [Tanacetum cinerariifolium]
MCEMVCQIFQKKQEEKRIEEEQAAKAQYWKIPACCDDDDDYNFAITPVLSTEETDNSLSMGDEHLDTIPATKLDEVIKSSAENLVTIPSEFEGIPDTMCDVHLINNPTPLEAKDHFEIVINSNDDICSSDDDSLYNENIECVEASPHDSEVLMSILNSEIHENLSSTTCVNLPIEDDHSPLLAYVVWIFLVYLTYPVIPPYLHPFGNEDTIFDPGITINYVYSFKPILSHRCGAFKKFNTHRSHLNEWPMIINGKNIPILDVLLYDWSFQAEEEPANYAHMAFSSLSSSSDNELENIRTHQSSRSLVFEVLIVGYEHVVMNCGSAGIRISSMTKALLIPKYQDHQTQHVLIIGTSQS